MNTAILIASRDLRDRARLFLIAIALAIVPFAAALGVRQNRPLAIVTVACFLAAAYTGALAIALGVSTVGRELSEKRLSFFFAKPVSAASIWIGKAAGGVLTWLGAFAIILLPAYVFVHEAWSDNWRVGGSLITFGTIAASVVLFFGSHAVSTMFRSRSSLVALDFALLGASLSAIFASTRPILVGGGLELVWQMLAVISAAIVLLLIAAPLWQLSRGRVEPLRSHAAFSTVFWSGMAVIVLSAAGFAWWVVSAPLSSITHLYSLEQSPSGKWISVSGQSKSRGSLLSTFLVDTATGEHERVPVSLWSTLRVSRDGSKAVWLENDELLPRQGTMRVHFRRLGERGGKTATPLVTRFPMQVQISDDGSRLALVIQEKIEVYELPSGRLLGAAQGVSSNVRQIFFAGPDVVRMLEIPRVVPATVRVLEFDLTTRKLTKSLEQARPDSSLINVTRDGSRLYLSATSEVLDARTGSVLFALPVKPERGVFGAMLADGSSIVTRDSKLYHFDAAGALVAEMAMPVKQAVVSGQLGSSKVLLSAGGEKPNAMRMLVVDLSTKKVDVVPGLRAPIRWWTDPMLPQFTGDATIAVLDGDRKLVLWDAKTGAKRPIPS